MQGKCGSAYFDDVIAKHTIREGVGLKNSQHPLVAALFGGPEAVLVAMRCKQIRRVRSGGGGLLFLGVRVDFYRRTRAGFIYFL